MPSAIVLPKRAAWEPEDAVDVEVIVDEWSPETVAELRAFRERKQQERNVVIAQNQKIAEDNAERVKNNKELVAKGLPPEELVKDLPLPILPPSNWTSGWKTLKQDATGRWIAAGEGPMDPPKHDPDVQPAPILWVRAQYRSERGRVTSYWKHIVATKGGDQWKPALTEMAMRARTQNFGLNTTEFELHVRMSTGEFTRRFGNKGERSLWALAADGRWYVDLSRPLLAPGARYDKPHRMAFEQTSALRRFTRLFSGVFLAGYVTAVGATQDVKPVINANVQHANGNTQALQLASRRQALADAGYRLTTARTEPAEPKASVPVDAPTPSTAPLPKPELLAPGPAGLEINLPSPF